MLWVTFAWGSCYAAITVGLRDAPLLWLAALRALIAGTALILVTGVRGTPRPRGGATWLLVIVMGVVNVALAYAAMFGGVIGLSTGAASVLANAQPLLILLPAWWFFREVPIVPTVAAMVVGFAGLMLVAIPSGFGTGAWLALISAAAVTTGTLIARVVDAEPLTVAAWQFLIGGAALTPVALIFEGLPVIEWSPRMIITLLYLSLVGTAATNVAWIVEAREARLDQLTTWTLLVPVFGITISVSILREEQGAWGWVGIIVVVVSLILLAAASRRQPRLDASTGQ
jgi:probable blue pigment (indigoidine) exporter